MSFESSKGLNGRIALVIIVVLVPAGAFDSREPRLVRWLVKVQDNVDPHFVVREFQVFFGLVAAELQNPFRGGLVPCHGLDRRVELGEPVKVVVLGNLQNVWKQTTPTGQKQKRVSRSLRVLGSTTNSHSISSSLNGYGELQSGLGANWNWYRVAGTDYTRALQGSLEETGRVRKVRSEDRRRGQGEIAQMWTLTVARKSRIANIPPTTNDKKRDTSEINSLENNRAEVTLPAYHVPPKSLARSRMTKLSWWA